MMKYLTTVPRAILGAVLGLTAALAPCLSQAQDYPVKPIRLFIPFTPGGGTDFVSRVVATKLSETLKWQVIPENKPGASGNLAIAEAARSAPDGYTIVMGQSDNMMLGPYLFANVGYDTVQSFTPIIQVSEAPLAIVSNAQPPGGATRLANVADMVTKGKTASGITWATAGNGSVGHVFGEQLKTDRRDQAAAGAVQGRGAWPRRFDGRIRRCGDHVGAFGASPGARRQAHPGGRNDEQTLADASRHADAGRGRHQGHRCRYMAWFVRSRRDTAGDHCAPECRSEQGAANA